MPSLPERGPATPTSLSREHLVRIGVAMNGLTAVHRFDIQRWLPHQQTDSTGLPLWKTLHYSGP